MTASLAAGEFTAAFARHGRALWLVAAAWVGREEAQDLVQETARIAWQQRGQFAIGSDLRAWLTQIVRNTGANWRRKLRPLLADELPDLAARPEVPAMRSAQDLDLPPPLAAALRELPAVARECLLLSAVGGLTFPEIADMLDLPVNTAMSHARRARLALRDAGAASTRTTVRP